MGKRRITLDIEEGVLAAVDQVADDRRESRNRFITDAIMRLLQENAAASMRSSSEWLKTPTI